MPSNTATTLQQQVSSQSLLAAGQGETQSQLETAIENQKFTAYGAALNDLQSSTNAAHALYYYGLRNADLSGAQGVALTTLTNSVQQMNSDRGLAKRQNEINEWTANNKLDTLFVYQQLLIILCTTIILVYLLKRGLLSTTVFFIVIGLLGLIFIFTIVNRVQYTNKLRDTQYWNKRKFEQANNSNVALCPTSNIDFSQLNNISESINARVAQLQQ
jgi:hypothetical protein